MRDDVSGEVWSPTALPIRVDGGRYTARHGQGYSRFEHDSHGIALELLQFVPPADPIKISRLTLTNHSTRSRTLSVTAYVEWVLGPSRAAAAQASTPGTLRKSRSYAPATSEAGRTAWTIPARSTSGPPVRTPNRDEVRTTCATRARWIRNLLGTQPALRHVLPQGSR